MLNVLRVFILLSPALFSLACATSGEEEKDMKQEPGALDIILCEQPRPQICTREYDPVCAKLHDGRIKTYTTGCVSCSDSQVESYTKGACEAVLQYKEGLVVQ
jgi:hypothetical protein